MLSFHKFLQAESAPGPVRPRSGGKHDGDGVDVSPEYRELVCRQLKRLGVPESMLEIDVHLVGDAPDGRPLYLILLKICHWRKQAGVKLLLAHGFIEASIRKAAAGTWLSDVSHFSGVWIRMSSRVQAGDAGRDIRRLLAQMLGEKQGADPRTGPATLEAVLPQQSPSQGADTVQ